MEKTIIIYGTNYGTTQRYAEEFARRFGIQSVPYEKAKIASDCKRIVYFGGLYAGGVKGLKETLPAITKTAYKQFVIVTVGLADVSKEENIHNIRTALAKLLPSDVYEKAQLYHLRGGIDYGRLNFMHKTMMKLLYEKVKKMPVENLGEEEKAMIETYGKKVDFVDFQALDEIEEGLKQGK